MSKCVIVFSTYCNSPFNDDCLFSNRFPRHFTSRKLCDYFWNDFKAICENSEKGVNSFGWNHVRDYLTNIVIKDAEQKADEIQVRAKQELDNYIRSNDELKGFVDKDSDQINSEIKKMKLEVKTKNNLDAKKLLDKEEYKLLIELLIKCRRGKSEIVTDVLKEIDSIKLTANIKDKGFQKTFNFGFPSGYGVDSDLCKDKPWFYYRYSYYEIRESHNNNEICVYAVWPLDPQAAKGNADVWIEALTEQFLISNGNEDADEFYLVLHNKDIESNSTFKVKKTDRVNNTKRTLVLFQHNDQVGEMLKERKSNSDIKRELKSLIYEPMLRSVADIVVEQVNKTEIEDTRPLYQRLKFIEDEKFVKLKSLAVQYDATSEKEDQDSIILKLFEEIDSLTCNLITNNGK